jgi:hypothetical protein
MTAADPPFCGRKTNKKDFAASVRVRLPDADAVLGGEVEFVGGLYVEGGVPAVFVADGEGTKLAGRVRIGEDLLAQGWVAGDGAPVLAEGDEELLVSGEVVDFGGCAAFE